MKRKEFVKSCGLACLGIFTAPTILQSCSSTRRISAVPEEGLIRLPKSTFIDDNGKSLRYLIIDVPGWKYPIAVFRRSDKEFKSVLLKCTHQGTELEIYGDLISCPAHGSEFSNEGLVFRGPASENLISFQTNFDDRDLTIVLA